MARSEREARREAHAQIMGGLAQLQLTAHGHFLPIGMATCLLLSEGSPVTADALQDELLALAKSPDQRTRELASRGIAHLEQLVEDLGRHD